MIRCGLAVSLLLLQLGAAFAAEPELAPSDPPESLAPAAPAAPEPRDRAVQGQALDELLVQLAKADEPRTAKRIAAAVQALWRRSGSDTIDLLLTRSTQAQRQSKLDVAIKLMDEVVSLKPDFAEGWNRRATLHFMAKDYDAAMLDIRQTLAREPRHFGAWLGLGRILEDSDLDAKALAAYRHVLAIYPQIEGLKKRVDDLSLKVEGQPI
ncbi:tetratricopeptide repeat protein [Hansschlegelia sp.]|uniref:tetratricopeptide repeat protein n=1 Tax=Hansschlegelia sp. TaxID=2041892 RepID=UPI002C525037|nr:tetratricopeptide repeat protein [Hansschlegelia sp.]HVI28804.1 tetratricopeptide repeat protein [Hansschlegelia sp.]